MDFRYNYVVFNAPDNKFKVDNDGYYTICTKDIEHTKNTRVVSYPLDNKPYWMRLIFNMHNSEKIAKYVNLPFKNLWYPYYFNNTFSEKLPFCFVIISRSLPLDYLVYLKKQYPDCKLVHMHRDFLAVGKKMRPDLHFNPIFDLEMTYDEEEAKQYNIAHFDEFESAIEIKRENHFESDVFFAGKAKDRLPLLLDAYSRLTNAGLKVYFYLTQVPKDKRLDLPGIIYSDSFMSYKEMLYHSVNTRCMLEIAQKDQHGYTSRFLEAVIYGKKLITNSAYVKHSKFYDGNNVQIVENMNNINVGFIVEGSGFVDYGYKNEFSPLNMIIRVEEELNKRF